MQETATTPRGTRRRGALLAIVAICALGTYVEFHHAIPAFRAWTFGLFALLVAVVTSLARGRSRDIGLVVASLALGVCILEAMASTMVRKDRTETTAGSRARDPVLGWRHGFAGIVHARLPDPRTGASLYDVHYTIDKDLHRKVDSTSRGPAVVFFGDSFTFGLGLNDADTLPQRFADLHGGKQRVLNLAVSGYSPSQFLREVETGLKDDVIGAKPIAFVFLTAPFHAKRTACKESWIAPAPRYALVDGKPVYRGACLDGPDTNWRRFLDHTALYGVIIRPLFSRLTHDDVDLYIRILIEAGRVSKVRYGVATIIPYVRWTPRYLAGTGYDDDAIIRQLKGGGLEVIDMTLVEDTTKPPIYTIKDDEHPAAAANAIRARMLAEALRTAGLTPNPAALE